MAREINFVAARRKKLTSEQKQDLVYFKYATWGVMVVVALLLVAVGVRLFAVYQVKKLTDAQASTRKAILSQEQVEKDYNVFAHKLKALSDLFGKRLDKQEAMVFFSQVFGQHIIISEIDYSAEDDDIVTFTLTAPSIFDLENVFTILEGPAVVEKYRSIVKSGLSRGSDGFYTIRLTIALGRSSAVETADAVPVEAEQPEVTE